MHSGLIQAKLIALIAFGTATVFIGGAFHLPAVAGTAIVRYIQPHAESTGSTAAPIIEAINNGKGPGLEGISLKGNGTVGQTQFNSSGSSNGRNGVLGQDLSTTGFLDVGVKGTSTNGTGVSGTSVGGSGVAASSIINDGIYSTTSNTSSTSGYGVSGVLGSDVSTDGGHRNAGVTGFSQNGVGMSGESNTFVAVNANGGGALGLSSYPSLSIVGATTSADLVDACRGTSVNPCDFADAVFSVTSGGHVVIAEHAVEPGYLIEVFNGSNIGVLTLTEAGNLTIGGKIFTAGTCATGCISGKNVATHRVLSYAPSQSMPSMDDFGEATLQRGYAFVPIDPSFANVIDRRANYLFFITPEGDSRGLYVTE